MEPAQLTGVTMKRIGRLLLLLLVISFLPPQHTATADSYTVEPIPLLKADYITGDLSRDLEQARNLISWQMDHGGWWKYNDDRYFRRWDGQEPRSDKRLSDGTEIGTIDNDATVNEILFLALMYRESGEEDIKQAALKGIDFLLNMQYETGGWPQVYPKNYTYADHVTFNDGAMIRVMNLLKLVHEEKYPFDSDLVSPQKRQQVEQALELGLDYILKSQIIVRDMPTAWGQQHDPFTYEPVQGRAFEHPAISAGESADIVEYLLAIPNPSEEVKKAIVAAIRWYDQVKLVGYRYDKHDPNRHYFQYDGESLTWYRLYEIGTNHPIFSDHTGIIVHNVDQLKDGNGGYSWAGNWGNRLLPYMETLEYFEEISYQLDVERVQRERARKAQEKEAEQAQAAQEVAEDARGQQEEAPQEALAASIDVAEPLASEPQTSQVSLTVLFIVTLLFSSVSFVLGRQVGKGARARQAEVSKRDG